MPRHTDYSDLINDPASRAVTEEEAKRLTAEDGRRARERREAREEAAGRTSDRRAAMRPHIEAVKALQPGGSCVMPYREFALAYRIARQCGFKISTQRRPDDTMVVRRKALTLGAAEGLL